MLKSRKMARMSYNEYLENENQEVLVTEKQRKTKALKSESKLIEKKEN